MQKRFYILFVARGDDGQLRKIPIPVHYLYVFVVGAAIGFLSLTGIASSYARMLLKVSRYNELRTEKEQLKDRYSRLEEVAKERDVQVASLGSIASEVSALYGLKSQPTLVTASQQEIQDADVSSSLDQLGALRTSALTGAATVGISLGLTHSAPGAPSPGSEDRPSRPSRGSNSYGPVGQYGLLPVRSGNICAVTFDDRSLSNSLCSLGVVDRGNLVCYLLPVIHKTFGRVRQFPLDKLKFCIPRELQTRGFRLGPRFQ